MAEVVMHVSGSGAKLESASSNLVIKPATDTTEQPPSGPPVTMESKGGVITVKINKR